MKSIITLLTIAGIASVSFGADDAGKGKGEKGKGKGDPAAFFAKKDANGDGKLSKEEFTKGAKDAAKAEAQFAAKDKDKDGSVSKEEFMAPGKKKAK